MDRTALNQKIKNRGSEFFRLMGEDKPSMFDRGQWMGKMMDWCMKDPHFKVQLLRFVDVFPTLDSSEDLTGHLQDYFADESLELPRLMKLGARSAGIAGKVGGALLGGAFKQQIKAMGRQFILGENAKEALTSIEKLRQDGFAFVVDLLGEATVCEDEAEQTLQAYIELLEALQQQAHKWAPLPGSTPSDKHLDWGHSPPINLSIKPTSFYSQTRALDFEGSVKAIIRRISPLYEKIIEAQGFLCIDMESTDSKEITLEVFRRLRSTYPNNNRLGIVLQAYLRSSEQDLEDLLTWAKGEKLPISIRLVKGAYWDAETIIAQQNDWPVPVFQVKAESDICFERMAQRILQNHEICHLACASHNIRSICAVLEMAETMGVPEEHYEFQLLYGMAEPVRKALLKLTRRVRLYCPYGQLLPGMAYLVRRLLENTSNDSFLRQSFAEGAEVDRLMEDPLETVRHNEPLPNTRPGFIGEPPADFTETGQRERYQMALDRAKDDVGSSIPLWINGEAIETRRTLDSVNPANPSEVIGTVQQAGIPEVDRSISAAKSALLPWSETPVKERANLLRAAADTAKEAIFDLAALQTLEVGKQWDQAYGDITEGIDFLRYYADQMEKLASPGLNASLAGESNRYFYQPKGVATVIAPWNFPFAISIGMVAAALVTGNTVVYKPSGLSSVTGARLVQLLNEAGLPAGALNFVPGPGSEIGDRLVDHPDVSVIAFTGSLEVGLRINQRAAIVHPDQTHLKKVICEMGGKNAIIVDSDADIDAAIPHILYSAFAFQGQKCSACSRLIVVDSIYDRLVDRLSKAAESLQLGPASDPANHMGPVVDAVAQARVLEAIDTACSEGPLLYQSPVPEGDGYYVPLSIIGSITPEQQTAQNEIFGPVLAIMRAENFDHALEIAGSTPFALTGGVFSRRPSHLDKARNNFRVGNLYLNRNNTGALVYRQPFGGFGLSGGGTKAGGPDYLLHFMDPRVITENTLRRGFAPENLS